MTKSYALLIICHYLFQQKYLIGTDIENLFESHLILFNIKQIIAT